MNESDARGEDDLGRREAEVMWFKAAFEGVDGGRCKDYEGYLVSNDRSGRTKRTRKEQEPKLVLHGVGTRKCWSEERRERTD